MGENPLGRNDHLPRRISGSGVLQPDATRALAIIHHVRTCTPPRSRWLPPPNIGGCKPTHCAGTLPRCASEAGGHHASITVGARRSCGPWRPGHHAGSTSRGLWNQCDAVVCTPVKHMLGPRPGRRAQAADRWARAAASTPAPLASPPAA
jgi:hypothetical protein